jgi:hypothetical protein
MKVTKIIYPDRTLEQIREDEQAELDDLMRSGITLPIAMR